MCIIYINKQINEQQDHKYFFLVISVQTGEYVSMDKRILKTRKCLRETMLELLKEKSYKKISVKEICEKSNTGRVTFYNHYDDKYDLLLDCFDAMQQKVAEHFRLLQKQNNPDNTLVRTFENMIDAIFDETRKYDYISLTEDLDLMTIYYHMVLSHLEGIETGMGKRMQTHYDQRQLNSFLALGFWGFLHGNESRNPQKTLRDAHQLAKDVAESSIFPQK